MNISQAKMSTIIKKLPLSIKLKFIHCKVLKISVNAFLVTSLQKILKCMVGSYLPMNMSQAEISQIIIQRTHSIEFKLVKCMLANKSFIAFLLMSYWTFSIVIKLFYHLFLNMSFIASLLKSHNP